ncbi:hypothetical protein [Nocardioides caldifontis]|uniref:hypothetical protein n=1 Tax=Nocardioides caldifontis TaxID=2588938 RepID=UPI0011E0044B|nr:hypothetical protein [Nocardioides caldifontis]
MDSVGTPGVLAAAAVAVVAVLVVVLAVAAVRRSKRASLAREQQLLAELRTSRDAVDALHQRVEELSDEVVEARRVADLDREYVITSLGDPDELAPVRLDLARAPQPPVADLLEERLVSTLARQRRGPLGRRAVDAVVRTVALGHGVRRALSPDVLDRAAAEAHVARRRSRRNRKREERQARRLLRIVKAQSRSRGQGGEGHAA